MTSPFGDLPATPARGPCPCGRAGPYESCCGRLHRGEARAVTAEDLLRSRYAAFAVGDRAYLLRTWHPATRPADLRLDPAQRWTGLEVLATDAGGGDDAVGEVTFRATFSAQGRAGSFVELSRFARRGRAWVYVDGDTEPADS